MKALQGKVAIVTGSSRGIGAAIARALAQDGAKVLVNYASKADAAEKLVNEFKSSGGQAIAVQADVGKPQDIAKLFDAAEKQLGKVDILVNNAGIILYKRIQDTSEAEFDRIFSTNVKGVFFALKEAATRLQNGGRIVNFSSSVTRAMAPTYGAYSATKAAVEQMSRVFAKEIGARGITVNSVLPGPTNTELFTAGKSEEVIKGAAAMAALGRLGEPEDIARVVRFLVSDEAGWITAQSIGVNGGTV